MFCPHCGLALAGTERFCPNCGTAITPTSGYAQQQPPVPQQFLSPQQPVVTQQPASQQPVVPQQAVTQQPVAPQQPYQPYQSAAPAYQTTPQPAAGAQAQPTEAQQPAPVPQALLYQPQATYQSQQPPYSPQGAQPYVPEAPQSSSNTPFVTSIVGNIILILAAFLPYVSVSNYFITYDAALANGVDGFILVLLCVVALICTFLKKTRLAAVMTAIAACYAICEVIGVHIMILTTSDTAFFSFYLVGFYLAIVGIIVNICAAVSGFRQKAGK